MHTAYADYTDWKGWDAAAFGRYSPVEAAAWRAEYGEVAGRTTLEIGFGNGGILQWLADSGATVAGVELNGELVTRARARHPDALIAGDASDAAFDAQRGRFDLIVANDVLEHIDEARIVAFLARLRELARPGGRIVLRYPNGDSPFGRIWQHGDVTHVVTIGHQKMHWFARRAGLRVVALRAPAEPLRGVGARLALVRAARRLARGAIDRLIRAVYLQNAPIPLSALVVCELTTSATSR